MEISAEKTKLMTNSANSIQREIKVKGQKLSTVTSFKYLGGSCFKWWFQTRDSLKREIKVKGQKLSTVIALSTLGKLFQTVAPNQRFSQGVHKPLQLLQS